MSKLAGSVAAFLLLLPMAGFCDQRADEDDRRCQEYGAVPGTRAYFDCRASLDEARSRRQTYEPPPSSYRPPPPPPPQNVTVAFAKMECMRLAKMSVTDPILKTVQWDAFSTGIDVLGKVSFSINKPGTQIAFFNVECRWRDGRMIDFQAR